MNQKISPPGAVPASPPPEETLQSQPVDANEPEKPGFFRRPAVVFTMGLLLVVLALAAANFVLSSMMHESTDDAFIDAHAVSVAPKVAGRVSVVNVDVNQDVKRGSVLFEIDPRDYKADLAQASANVHVAEAKRETAQTTFDQATAQATTAKAEAAAAQSEISAVGASASTAKSDVERSRQLAQGGAISKQELEHIGSTATSAQANLRSTRQRAIAAEAHVTQANAQVSAAKAQIAAADAEIEQAKAAEAEAQLKVDYTRIIAPIDGRVTNKSVEPGAYVQIGQSVMILVPEDCWATANFKETQLREIRPGQPAVIHIDAYNLDFRGHVDSIQAGSGARFSLLPPENATGNFVKVVQRVPVKIVFDELPDKDHVVGPGMSVVPTVQVRTIRSAPLILVAVAIAAVVVACFLGRLLLRPAD